MHTPSRCEGAQSQQSATFCVPAGTRLDIAMDSSIDADSLENSSCHSVLLKAHVTRDYEVDGQVGIPAGTVLIGQMQRIAHERDMYSMSFCALELPGRRVFAVSVWPKRRGGIIRIRRSDQTVSLAASTEASCGPLFATTKVDRIPGVQITLKRGRRFNLQVGDEFVVEAREDIRIN